jgi:hypothetical protein
MRFETEQDRIRERKAIELFVGVFGGSYKKLDPHDIDFKVFDDSNSPIAYAEVKGRNRPMRSAYPLPISARKLTKLVDKRLNPVIIWACEDGIIYGKVQDLVGVVRFGGRKEREGAVNDEELMVYFDKQPEFKYIRF